MAVQPTQNDSVITVGLDTTEEIERSAARLPHPLAGKGSKRRQPRSSKPRPSRTRRRCGRPRNWRRRHANMRQPNRRKRCSRIKRSNRKGWSADFKRQSRPSIAIPAPPVLRITQSPLVSRIEEPLASLHPRKYFKDRRPQDTYRDFVNCADLPRTLPLVLLAGQIIEPVFPEAPVRKALVKRGRSCSSRFRRRAGMRRMVSDEDPRTSELQQPPRTTVAPAPYRCSVVDRGRELAE